MITAMGLFKNLRSVRINSYNNFFLYLHAFMLLSGRLESDNHNGTTEKCEKRLDELDTKNFLHFVWLHILKW